MTIIIAEPSCFGTSLSALARLPGPIRELGGTEDLLPEAQAHNSPRELMKLIGWLMSHDVGAVVRPSSLHWHHHEPLLSTIYSSHRETNI
jgi:hypothetical protein